MLEKTTAKTREDLIFLLSQAAELEHSLACQYLYAAYSLKQTEAEGITADEKTMIDGWRNTLLGVAVQEMLHLALVSNMLTAIGSAPMLDRANFPQPKTYTTIGLRFALSRFSEQTLRRFICFERPEGLTEDNPRYGRWIGECSGKKLEFLGAALPKPLVPGHFEFKTIGELYELILQGFAKWPENSPGRPLFIGPTEAQVNDLWQALVPLRDFDGVKTAIETIRTQGEGSHGVVEEQSHFARFVEIFEALEKKPEEFQPARMALDNPLLDGHRDILATAGDEKFKPQVVTNDLARDVMEIFASTYELMLHVLGRFFVNLGETDEQRYTLKQAALSTMRFVLTPLGQAITRIPASKDKKSPWQAGPSFELFERLSLLPYKDAAWTYLIERFNDNAAAAKSVAIHESTNGFPAVRSALEAAAAVLSQYALALDVARKAPPAWTWENGVKTFFTPLDAMRMSFLFDLRSYEAVVGSGDAIEDAVSKGQMPPADRLAQDHIEVDHENPEGPWTTARIDAFKAWRKDRAPRG